MAGGIFGASCGLFSSGCMDFLVVAGRFRCSEACRIGPDQGSNVRPCIGRQTLYPWATGEALSRPSESSERPEVPHCGLVCPSSYLMMLSTCSCIYWPCVSLLWRSVHLNHLPPFKVGCLFITEVEDFVVYFRCKSLIRYFLSFCELSSHFLNSMICSTCF